MEKRGISLIVLLVTIIMLSIIAGATILLISGENGIVNMTIDAKIKAEVAAIIEDIQIKEISKLEAVIENPNYIDKLFYVGEGQFYYDPNDVTDKEKIVFESNGFEDISILYSYSARYY